MIIIIFDVTNLDWTVDKSDHKHKDPGSWGEEKNEKLNLSRDLQEHIGDPTLGFSSTSANCWKAESWLSHRVCVTET